MEAINAFPADYHTSRNRFRALSKQLTDELKSYPILYTSESLSIDVSTIGDPQANRKVIVSSGLHGIEGFVGAAIQLALLDGLISNRISMTNCAIVLIHAVNPYGFKYLRRVNEDNIDLNRNFLSDFNQKPIAAEYANFNSLLNPGSQLSRFDAFTLKAYLYICRYGIRSLRQSISAGQYDFPKGLFYGGKNTTQSTRIIQQILQGIDDKESEIFHIDIHSGLGNYAGHKLLLAGSGQSTKLDRYKSKFDASKIELIGENQGITSTLNGTIGHYFGEIMAKSYHHLGLEFGTYSNIRLLKAMRLENAAHHYMDDGDQNKQRIKAEFLECFCPSDPVWRNTVVTDGLNVINQALH